MTTVSLPLSCLVGDDTQPRKSMSDGEFDSLVASIRIRGMLLPLRVKPANPAGKHVIISGHRRFAALVRIGAATADCIVNDGPLNEATVLAEQLTENLLREDLSPIDEADGYRRYLFLRGITAAQAAEELNVSPTRFSRALPLLNLPSELRDAVHTGRVSKETGYYLARYPEGDDRDELIARALSGSLTRDRAARAVRAARSQPAEHGASRVTCKLAGGRTLTVSGSSIKLDLFIEILEDVLKEARKARTQSRDLSTLPKVFRDRAAAGGTTV